MEQEDGDVCADIALDLLSFPSSSMDFLIPAGCDVLQDPLSLRDGERDPAALPSGFFAIQEL